MKTTITMLALCFAFTSANAQHLKDADVPAKVKESFKAKFPGSAVKTWEKEGADFEAEFDLNKVESSAIFDSNANFKEMEQEIKISGLPNLVSEYCTKTYPGYKLSEAAKITDASGKVSYEAEMEKGKEHFDVLFDEAGKFIRKSDPSSKEEDKD